MGPALKKPKVPALLNGIFKDDEEEEMDEANGKEKVTRACLRKTVPFVNTMIDGGSWSSKRLTPFVRMAIPKSWRRASSFMPLPMNLFVTMRKSARAHSQALAKTAEAKA
ncbi:hypothetical protein Pyn_40904 [Prunus yedoensis var. nudiflora]|uniref:Uncharacterized protein n=1 Tax=Prunus yedoensis var. nudiflora TaxID=2094558 RepID=A0A314UDH3_PRUYE|nr:hypothetical protein Pyn_40904 [Prunus yedoensis var. nudiflora]